MGKSLDQILIHMRACIANDAISTTLIQTEDLATLCNAAEYGMRLDVEDHRDASLFRFWIKSASSEPYKIAKAISHCLHPSEYRAALHRLAAAEGINLP